MLIFCHQQWNDVLKLVSVRNCFPQLSSGSLGDPKVPVLYQVERTRDGRSFSVRSVKAIQHGQPILICQASFHMLQESPLQHQFTMPVVPQPEDLLTVEELIQLYLR